MDWNPNDYQGKRQDQVEGSYKIVGYCFLGLLILLVICSLINI